MTLAPARRPARAHELAPGQPVEFFRPSPRGGRGLCRGEVISGMPGSVVVRCTESTVIGFPVGTQLRLTDQEVTVAAPGPLSAPLPPSERFSLREPVRAAVAAPGAGDEPPAPASAATTGRSVDFDAVFTERADRRTARAAFDRVHRLLAGAGAADRFALAEPAMSAGNPREVNFVSTDGTATLWVVQLRRGEQFLVAYDGPGEDWSRVFPSDGKDLAAALPV